MRNEQKGDRVVSHEPTERILLVDDGEFTRHRVKSVLRAEQREVRTASSGREALETIREIRPDVVLVSLGLDDLPGVRSIDVLLQAADGVPVIALAPEPSVDQAVDALRRGCVDYVPLRAPRERLNAATSRALQEARKRAARDLQRVRDAVRDQYGFGQLLTQSPNMLAVFDQIRAVARTDATVLILGETGTGKELVSRAIHDRSRRADQPFIAVNCGAFTESLLESELFGHEKGSFTGATGRRAGMFEMAHGGTLFLDELGETTLNVQVNLLRVLEDMSFRRVGGRENVHVDVRIVAATNVNLGAAVKDGRFREDLFYRLDVFPIRLPPLRERREDIPLLMRHFLDELAEEYGLEAPLVSADAIAAILGYAWPGNVRQLRSMCERWVITRSGQRLEREHLPTDMTGHSPRSPHAAPRAAAHVDATRPMRDNVARVVEHVEREYLTRVLEQNLGHLGKTADAAGITRRTLYTKMRLFDLDAADFKQQ
ncbi:MAG: DNA-binding NtrC family response regulator [Myxococcota bacterium]|jgi:DNA-binding NtrC family response regulator